MIETLGDHSATIIIPNASVSHARIEKSDFMGATKLNLVSVESSDQACELGIGFLDAEDELRIRAAFPNARLSICGEGAKADGEQKPRRKGLLALLGF